MIMINTITEYDNYVEEQEERAKKQYPGYVRYEVCADTGELFLWSLGAYPSIIKGFCERIDFNR